MPTLHGSITVLGPGMDPHSIDERQVMFAPHFFYKGKMGRTPMFTLSPGTAASENDLTAAVRKVS